MEQLVSRFEKIVADGDYRALKVIQRDFAAAGIIMAFVTLVEKHRKRVDEINTTAKATGLATWQDGTLFLNKPGGVVVTCDKIIYRRNDGGIQFLVADRKSPCFWGQDRLSMITIGGFSDARVDQCPMDTASREVSEEIGKLKLDIIGETPLIHTGYWKWSHYWDGTQAVPTGILAQNIPILTLNFLARCTGGELNESNEAANPRWIALQDIPAGTLFAFDHALVLQAALKRLKA